MTDYKAARDNFLENDAQLSDHINDYRDCCDWAAQFVLGAPELIELKSAAIAFSAGHIDIKKLHQKIAAFESFKAKIEGGV
jgi:hypothetical protein